MNNLHTCTSATLELGSKNLVAQYAMAMTNPSTYVSPQDIVAQNPAAQGIEGRS